jgi:hypothetical protein
VAFQGMDIGQAKQLEARLQTEADRLSKLTTDLGEKVGGSTAHWKGPDANAFRTKVWPEIEKLLTDVRTTLVAAKSTIETQRVQQERASAAS